MSLTVKYIKAPTAPVEVQLPGSKSYAARAVMANLYHIGGHERPLRGLPESDDVKRILEASERIPMGGEIHVGASGTALRLLLPYAASNPGVTTILNGTERLLSRPMTPLVEALRSLGAEIDYTLGRPVKVVGKHLAEGSVSIRGDVSSQFISALMLQDPAREIILQGRTVSAPYIEMTRRIIEQWQRGTDAPYTVPADWSAAAYIYEYQDITGATNVHLPSNLVPAAEALQPDRAIAALAAAPRNLPMDADLTDCPDLAPALAALIAARATGGTLVGVERLRDKECDRLDAICRHLTTLGYHLRVEADRLQILPGKPATAPQLLVVEEDDHRIAMAFAIMSAAIPGLQVRVTKPWCVDKSFPGFFDLLPALGYQITEN